MHQPLTGQMRALVWSILAVVLPWGLLLGLFAAHTSVFWMWAMRDPRSAVLVGAVYIGATVYYIAALRLNDWEQTKSGVEGAFVVSAVLLAAVALDWNTVRPYHLMTIIWLIAYYGPLFLIPILFRREEDLQGTPQGERILGAGWRRWMIARGAVYLGLTVLGFVFAPLAAAHWPWRIDPLEVRMFLGATRHVRVGERARPAGPRLVAAVPAALLVHGRPGCRADPRYGPHLDTVPVGVCACRAADSAVCRVEATYLLRHIAVNPLHNVIHIILGVSGLLAARRADLMFLWCRTVGPVLLLLFVVGLAHAWLQGFPRDQSLLGLVALNSAGHTFHFATGVIALLLGSVQTRATKR
ncbi:MAG: DUF4383 domain-containing protein [Armatimonadota bacterium]